MATEAREASNILRCRQEVSSAAVRTAAVHHARHCGRVWDICCGIQSVSVSFDCHNTWPWLWALTKPIAALLHSGDWSTSPRAPAQSELHAAWRHHSLMTTQRRLDPVPLQKQHSPRGLAHLCTHLQSGGNSIRSPPQVLRPRQKLSGPPPSCCSYL